MDLLEALKRIKDECNSHDECCECPLRDSDEDECYVSGNYSEHPNCWVFASENPVPRLFY